MHPTLQTVLKNYYNMKVLFVVLSLFLFVMLNKGQKYPHDPRVMKCLQETNTTDDEIVAFFKAGGGPVALIKCYTKCMLITKGVMSEDGKFFTTMPKFMAESNEMKKCLSMKLEGNEDLCDLAFRHNACSYDVAAHLHGGNFTYEDV